METTIRSNKLSEKDLTTTYYVYQAKEEHVRTLEKIPHTYFYKSIFQPCICMKTQKKHITNIATLPFVYCIRVIPPAKVCDVKVSEAREIDDIAYVQQNEDSSVDSWIDIAVIDTGYDYYEDDLTPTIREAEDNIEYTHDFTDGDSDVTDGDNHHGTTVLDILARALGDTGDDDWTYEDPKIYYVLKAGEGDTIDQTAARRAMEWCLQNAVEIICISWAIEGSEDSDRCDGYWCGLFKNGAEAGKFWVGAAGNEYKTDAVGYPAKSFYVIAVGGYDEVDYSNKIVHRADFSNHGWIKYEWTVWWFWKGECEVCNEAESIYSNGDHKEFKPQIYDAGVILPPPLSPPDFSRKDFVEGTSYTVPLVAAAIAIGALSSYIDYNFPTLRIVLSDCHEWNVASPWASAQWGDVVDAHTLWHGHHVSE